MEIKTIQLNDTVFLTIKGVEYRQMKIDDIVWVSSKDHYVTIRTINAEYRVCTSMKSISKYLNNFVKVDNALIVNKYYISSLIKNPKNSDNYYLVLAIVTPDGYLTREISSYLARKVIEQL